MESQYVYIDTWWNEKIWLYLILYWNVENKYHVLLHFIEKNKHNFTLALNTQIRDQTLMDSTVPPIYLLPQNSASPLSRNIAQGSQTR